MKKISLVLLILLTISIESTAQKDYQKFVSRILITHEKNNNYENDLENLKKALQNNERDFDYLKEALPEINIELPPCEYEFITCYRVNFKKMSSIKKKRLQREKFFSYLSTKKLYHVETYVFCKGGVFLGSLRGGATGVLHFLRDNNEVKKIAENYYEQIHKKTNPGLFFCTRIPFVQDFIIVNDSIKPIDYDDDFNWRIYDNSSVIFD